MKVIRKTALVACASLFIVAQPSAGQSDVLTSRYDNERTGAALSEHLLTPDAIDSARDPGAFGYLFHYDLRALLQISRAGDIYAQPLYAEHLRIPGHGLANLLLVATMKNYVIALDADGPRPGTDGVLWRTNLGPAPSMDDVWANCHRNQTPCGIKGGNIRENAGIASTPVIDRRRGIVFAVARIRMGVGAVRYRLHALDLRTGGELAGSPVEIAGAASGVQFSADDQNQRPGLALARGQVIVAFGAYEDFLKYYGWVFSYRYDTAIGFVRSAVFVTTPDGDPLDGCNHVRSTPESFAADAAVIAAKAQLERDRNPQPPRQPNLAIIERDERALQAAQIRADEEHDRQLAAAANNCAHGGIWMSGRAPAIDASGRVLLMVGNGRNDMRASGTRNFGNSLLALDPVSLAVLDFFTPANHISINALDLDLGGSGPLVIPNSPLVVGGGKEGVMHVWNLGALGAISPGDRNVVQKFVAGIAKHVHDTGEDNPGGAITSEYLLGYLTRAGSNFSDHAGHIMGGPVYWPRPASEGGSRLYNWSEWSELRSYAVDPAANPPVREPAVSVSKEIQLGHPGGILTLSANGGKAGTGIVWATNYDVAGTPDPTGNGPSGALVRVVRGTLLAYNADDLSRPLWTSDMNPMGIYWHYAKFNPPTVANGRVYLATFSDSIVVYGLRKHRYQRPLAAAIAPITDLSLDGE